MPTLRLFAGLKELAGIGALRVEGETVEEVVRAAEVRFGPTFREHVRRARIWVNGEEADLGRRVGPDDEIAILPPVSGGAGVAGGVTPGPEVGVPLLVLASLALANLVSSEAWWAAAVVGLGALWVGDVASTASNRGRDLPVVPAFVGILATVVASHLLGPAGFFWGPAAAVIATLGWGVASDSSRMLQILAPAMLVALLASTMVGSLFLAYRLTVPQSRATAVFLLAVGMAVVAAMLVERFPSIPVADPFSVSASAAVAGALIGAAIWQLDLVAFLIVGLAVAVALVAGRGLGSMLRTRRVHLIDLPPGLVPALDGVVLAGCVYYPMLLLVLVV